MAFTQEVNNMANDVVFGKASEADIEALVRIRLEYLNTDFSVSGEQEEQLMNELPGYYRKHLGNDFIAYIAKVKGEIVASAFLVIFEMPANTNFITGRIGNVLNVYTKPQYRRQGVASRLMSTLIKEAKVLSLSYLELKATADGYPLYQKLGFQNQIFIHIKPMRLDL